MLARRSWRLLPLFALAFSSVAQPTTPEPCRSDQLEVTVANAGVGMSHWAEGVDFRNSSADTCSLRGVPKLAFSGAGYRRLPVALCPNCDDYLFPARQITSVVLKSGQLAHILIGSSTAYDAKLCDRASALQISLPNEQRPIPIEGHEMYYCVKIDVSAFLPGTTRNDTRWSGPPLPPPTPSWGQSTRGMQISLTPFSPWQRLGVLGFHLALRGRQATGLQVRQCQSATLRMWQAGKLAQSITSTERLTCLGPGPQPAANVSGQQNQDITTQEFGMRVDHAGFYAFDIVEVLEAAGDPVTVTSNRISIQITNN